MRFDVFSLFPEVFKPYLQISILDRAVCNHIIEINLHNIRDWAQDKHHTTDDTPFGGGGGMIMKAEPIFSAVEATLGENPSIPIILMSPQGSLLTQEKAYELSKTDHLALICGRYEGVDERIREHLATQEISIGDYVLSGGELPALVLIEAITRLLPGALGDPGGAADDSFASGLLEFPHYTRPAEFRGWEVPEVLRSGNHKEISHWRRKQALLRTVVKRPDLLEKEKLSALDRDLLKELLDEGKISDKKLIKTLTGES